MSANLDRRPGESWEDYELRMIYERMKIVAEFAIDDPAQLADEIETIDEAYQEAIA